MAAPACVNCVYSICDPEVWLRCLWAGEPLLPRCANHPCWPGQLHDVPGVACRNYRPKPALPEGDVRLIPLGDGFYAYVDAADYEWLRQWNWVMRSGGYAVRCEKGRTLYMHREIMKPAKGMVVDHMDGNKANNCRCNLRVCTFQENHRNNRKRHHACSRFKGVGYNKDDHKWYARFGSHKDGCWTAFFETELEAARAWDYAVVAWFGLSIGLNFPAEWPPERRAQVYADAQAEREAVRAKIPKAKRRRARKARAKKQEAKEKGQKNGKRTPSRVKPGKHPKHKRTARNGKQATKMRRPKARRARKNSETA
jgi:hypothetical protein